MVSIKIRFGDEIRRISVEKTCSFKVLLGQLRKLLDINDGEDIVVKYLDDEGDKVTLSSDFEFKEALLCCREPIQLFASTVPRGTLSCGTLENLDISLSQILIVAQEEKNKLVLAVVKRLWRRFLT